LDRAWWTSFLIFFVMGALWSLASPLFSVADEPAHVVRAAAVGRGQLGGKESTEFVDHQVRTEVQVPLVYATATTLPACYIGRIDVSAGCAAPFAGPTETGPVLTQVGRYPPSYYALVGLPTRWLPAAAGVRLMRLLTAAVAAALLASAFGAARGLAVVGLAVAVTPMVVFFAGSVNPSGIELAAAVAFWTGLIGLVLDRTDGAATRVAVAGSALLLARQLGPLMAGLIVVVIAVVAGRAQVRAALARPEVRRAAVVLGAVALAAVAWIVIRHTFTGIGGTPPRDALSPLEVIRTSLGRTPRNVLQMIGSFGWTDTPAPAVTYYLWFACIGLLGFAALARTTRRETVALVLLTALVVAVPVALESPRAREIGFVWLGRYILPLAAGLPLLAARFGADLLRTAGARLVALVAGAVALGHVLAFVWALDRFTGGLATGREWSPPGTAPVLILAFAGVAALYGWWLTRLAALSPRT
jgi:hypothetical protein